MTKFPIAIELLEIEHDRLMRDHYDTNPPNTDPTSSQWMSCDGCARAFAVRQELDALRKEVTA